MWNAPVYETESAGGQLLVGFGNPGGVIPSGSARSWLGPQRGVFRAMFFLFFCRGMQLFAAVGPPNHIVSPEGWVGRPMGRNLWYAGTGLLIFTGYCSGRNSRMGDVCKGEEIQRAYGASWGCECWPRPCNLLFHSHQRGCINFGVVYGAHGPLSVLVFRSFCLSGAFLREPGAFNSDGFVKLGMWPPRDSMRRGISYKRLDKCFPDDLKRLVTAEYGHFSRRINCGRKGQPIEMTRCFELAEVASPYVL